MKASDHHSAMQNSMFRLLVAKKLKAASDQLFSTKRAELSERNSKIAEALATAKKTAEDGSRVGFARVTPLNHVPAYLLLGYAIENVAKGIIANTAPTNRGLLGSHDLVGLVDATQFRISDDVRDNLHRLTAIVIWAGRYPAPTRPEDYDRANLPSHTLPAELFLSVTDDLDRLSALYSQIESMLQEKLPALPIEDAIVVWRD